MGGQSCYRRYHPCHCCGKLTGISVFQNSFLNLQNMRRPVIAYLLLLAAVLPSCTLFSSLVHDGEVVAKVGKARLYRHDLEKYIPSDASPGDSALLAANYINSWITDRLFLEEAERQLSKAEMDVSEELEAYRLSLVRYRYEQRYVADRLDTLVTDAQIEEYYNAHADDFELDAPVVKVRFIDVMADSPAKDELLDMMSSDDYATLSLLDSLAGVSALRYFDNSDKWMSAEELAVEFGTDYVSLLSRMKGGMIEFEPEGRGDLLAAYICDIVRTGPAPLEYCSSSIRNIILSSRKHELLKGLERDLLDNARENKNIEINQQK